MKYIPLGKDKFAIVDDNDYESLAKFKWYYHTDGCAIRTSYIGKKQHVRMHRQILNAPPGLVVDHINGNRIDNRRSNIRLCTMAQNSAHRLRMPAWKLCKYRGVTRKKKRWAALICVRSRIIYLGSFIDCKDAAIAYDRAAKKFFGEFAVLNNIES